MSPVTKENDNEDPPHLQHHQPGSHRIVPLADGNALSEGLTNYDRPSHFVYRVSNPGFTLRHLMIEAGGEFWFEPADGGTAVKWTYTFHAKTRLTRLPLALFVKSQRMGYRDVCLTTIIKHFAGSPITVQSVAARTVEAIAA